MSCQSMPRIGFKLNELITTATTTASELELACTLGLQTQAWNPRPRSMRKLDRLRASRTFGKRLARFKQIMQIIHAAREDARHS